MSNLSEPAAGSDARISKLAIAVTFHFVRARLGFLQRINDIFRQLADQVEVYVITNVADRFQQAQIRQCLAPNGIEPMILVPALLGHPYLLTWCHRDVFRQRFEQDTSVSHFLYVEDDIQVGPQNIQYWLRGREQLRRFGLIPSFLRYEQHDGTGPKLATDIIEPVDRRQLPHLTLSEQSIYLNMPNPYQAMYLLDRELMAEMMASPNCGPEYGPWGIREKAAQGVTFCNVPPGCFSRNFVGFDVTTGQVDPGCLVHHTANNYANDPESKFGKIRIEDLVIPVTDNQDATVPAQALAAV